MNARELRMTNEQLLAERDRQRAARTASRQRTAPRRKPRVEAREARDARDAAFYERAKRDAAARATETSNEHLGPRCEYVISVIRDREVRCPAMASDPDHVIGGAYRKDSERLGAEGLECLCRSHHDMKHHNSPSRLHWLDHAEDHARRYGYGRLLALVEKARARYEAKHPASRTP